MSALLKTILLIFEEIFYFIFPLSPDEQRIKKLTRQHFLEKLQVRTQNDVVTLAYFKDPEIKAALHLVKFHGHTHAITLVSALFEAWLLAQAQAGTVIIPIPLSKQRERSRGFNQCVRIAERAVADHTQYCVDATILRRQKHTVPQTSLARTERLKNLEDAFVVSPKTVTLSGIHIVLLDDVLTTGATLRAAKATLLPLSPASITCVAIAH